MSKSNQSVKTNISKRDEINETRKINVEALIEQKVSEKVDRFLKEQSKVNSAVNLT